jgi:hypothetical protein
MLGGNPDTSEEPPVSIPTGSALATSVLRVISAGLTGAAGVLIGWGSPRWHQQPSLNYVRQNPMPWWLWGVLFILAAVLIMVPTALRASRWAAGHPAALHLPRVLGWTLGFALYAYFAYSADYAWLWLHVAYSPAILAAVNGWPAVWLVAAAVAARAAAHAGP